MYIKNYREKLLNYSESKFVLRLTNWCWIRVKLLIHKCGKSQESIGFLQNQSQVKLKVVYNRRK